MENNFKYDVMQMYFGDDYYVTDEICIKQPTIGQIIEYGETEFWVMVSILCANSTSVRLELWHKGIDWNDISDFDLFTMTVLGIPQDKTEIVFGDLDFTKMRLVETDDGKKVLVYLKNPVIQIDEEVYTRLVEYLRCMFNIHPKVEKTKYKGTKEDLIWEDELNLKQALKEQKKSSWKKSTLFPLISAALNHPGFKYKKSELKEVGIFEFMDSAKRLQVYENVTSLMTGMYMGMLDTSKLDLGKELNWARDLYED